jgi:uncharacterized protein
MNDNAPGQIMWMDLTAPNASELRDFYEAVIGWRSAPVAMGSHEDWNMMSPGSPQPVAGVCHAAGDNAGLPAVWLPYITVADLAESIEACKARGGQVVFGPKSYGPEGRWCVIRDPAGAHAALYEGKQAA